MNVPILIKQIVRSVGIKLVVTLIIHTQPACVFDEYLDKILGIASIVGISIKERIQIIGLQQTSKSTRSTDVHLLQDLSGSTYRGVNNIALRITNAAIHKGLVDDIGEHATMSIRFSADVNRYFLELFRRNSLSRNEGISQAVIICLDILDLCLSIFHTNRLYILDGNPS